MFLDIVRRCLCDVCVLYLWYVLGGRTLKSGNIKNHLQDKIYGYELATACVEFEERIRVPLSLLNEALFEASFICRDELIEAFRSKVALDAERKAVFFKGVANAIVANIAAE